MSVNYSSIQSQRQTRNGLAVASLVLGIISIPTLGLLGVGAITAIALGAIALNRIKKEPATHGGKGMAVAGIITSVVSLLLIPAFVILAPVIVRQLFKKESSPIQTLRLIHYSQAQFQAEKRRFGTLKELGEAGYVDANYANGAPVSGYIYTSTEVTQDKYCVQATRVTSSIGSRDFNVIEDGIIRFVESTAPNPVPHGEGASIADAGPSAGTGAK